MLDRRPLARLARAAGSVCVVFWVAFCVACGGGDGGGETCGDIRATPAPKVYFGTLEPSHVPLTQGQMMAIGTFQTCTGTLVAPTWVLTAAHCQLSTGVEFCIGEQPDDPSHCVASTMVVNHPDVDMTLVQLAEKPGATLPEVTPIPIMTEPLGASWIGRRAEAAGYGLTETDQLGTRYFVAEPIVDMQEVLLTVDGEGKHGVCFGDSGGPALVIADDGTIRVAGALSNGDETCVGRDNFTRTDAQQDWIERFTGPTLAEDGGICGSIDAEGQCSTGRATWCGADGLLAIETCADGSQCGWDAAAGGFRCITGADPCEGFDSYGGCEGSVAHWCEGGTLRSRDCGVCGEVCNPFGSTRGVICEVDPCMGLDYLGRCSGDVAEWCESGELRRRDCTTMGQTCAYIDDETGYYCR